MKIPVPAQTAEEIIYFYIELRYRAVGGEAIKIANLLEKRAEELGVALRTAWRFIRQGRNIGMVQA